MWRGMCDREGDHTPSQDTVAVGTHPTRMHSCLYYYRPLPKLQEGNVFTHVCLSAERHDWRVGSINK